MKDQVVMAPSGHLCVAVPLFRMFQEDALENLSGYVISLTNEKPIAYALDAGPEVGKPQLMNADFVEKNCEFLGDL